MLNKAAIIIPSNSRSFITWAKETSLGLTQKSGRLMSVNATPQSVLTIKPHTEYQVQKSVNFRDENSLAIQDANERIILKIDLVEEYRGIIQGIMNPEESTLHRVITGLPIPYGLAPASLRDFLMKNNSEMDDLALCHKLPMDALRFIILNAIEKLSGRKLEKTQFLKESNPCVLSHDVETANGLKRTSCLRKIEEKYDVSSVWYIPSNRYKLDNHIISELANDGEVDRMIPSMMENSPTSKNKSSFGDSQIQEKL